MRFTARHVSFGEVDGAKVLAFGDRNGAADGQPGAYAVLSFGDEDDQDRALGLTGLYLETHENTAGYGHVGRVDFDGRVVTIVGRDGLNDIEILVETDMMTVVAIQSAVDQCNQANGTNSEIAE